MKNTFIDIFSKISFGGSKFFLLYYGPLRDQQISKRIIEIDGTVEKLLKKMSLEKIVSNFLHATVEAHF
jgi:hypothetical protein